MYSTQQVEDGCEATAAIHIGFATYTQNLGISHSWSANQRRPHSAKKKLTTFWTKGLEDVLHTVAEAFGTLRPE